MKEIVLRRGLPVLVLAIAGIQFLQVYTNQLTRWKGGGFGMYSEMHPLHKQVWLRTGDTILQLKKEKGKVTPLAKAAHRLRFQPNEAHFSAVGKLAAATFPPPFTIELWSVTPDPSSNRLVRTLEKKITINR